MFKFKTWFEAIETPPHMLEVFYHEHLKAFEYVGNLIKQVKQFDNFYEFYKSMISRMYYEKIEQIIDTSLISIDNIIKYLKWGLESKHMEDQARWLKNTIDGNLLSYLKEIDFDEAEKGFEDLKKETADAKKDWPIFRKTDPELGDYDERLKQIDVLEKLIKSVRKMSKWYEVYTSKTKSFIDTLQRKFNAYYNGINKEIKPDSEKTETLYHATTSVSGILQNGFKTRDELGRGAMGGGPSNVISFTADVQIAEAIVWAIKRAHEAATGRMGYKQLMALANKLGATDAFVKYIEGGRGKHDYISRLKGGPFNNEGGPMRSVKTIRDIEERKEWVFEAFRALLHYQGKIYNPLMFGVTYKDFEKVNLNDVGIIAAEVDMSQTEYLSSMEEYRAPIPAIGKMWKVPYKGVLQPTVNY